VARCVEFRRDWKRARVSILLQEEQIRQQQIQQAEPTLLALDGGNGSEKSIFRRCVEKKVQERQKKQHPMNSDEEIKTAERLFQSLSSDLTSKQSLFEEKSVEKGKAMESSLDRAHRLEQGKEQLKRIQQDTSLIQHELIEVQEQLTAASTKSIREQKPTDGASVGHIMRPIDQTSAQVARPSNALGSSFNYYQYNHATKESSSFVTPSPRTAAQKTGTPHYSVIQGQNQAFQRSSTQRQQQKTNSNSWNRNPYAPKKVKTKTIGAASPPALAQPMQHAHKAGNQSKARKYNRQFTTTLQIETNCPEDISQSTSTDFFDTGKVGLHDNSERTIATITTPNLSVNTNATSEKKLLLRDEDEDEGSDLLSYIAFGNE
jgi:hypothetical protein